MNEILLTPEESEDARTKAEVAVRRRHGDITEQIQAGNEAVLRAQVRKVADALAQHIEKPCEYPHLCTAAGDRQDMFLPAFRATGGE